MHSDNVKESGAHLFRAAVYTVHCVHSSVCGQRLVLIDLKQLCIQYCMFSKAAGEQYNPVCGHRVSSQCFQENSETVDITSGYARWECLSVSKKGWEPPSPANLWPHTKLYCMLYTSGFTVHIHRGFTWMSNRLLHIVSVILFISTKKNKKKNLVYKDSACRSRQIFFKKLLVFQNAHKPRYS